METNAAAGPASLDWTAAQALAHRRRDQRLRPDPATRRRKRRLAMAAIALWIPAVGGALAGLLVPGSVGDALGLTAYLLLAAYVVVVMIWSAGSGRFQLRGSPASIRNALPTGSWPFMKRQLVGRSPIDPEHQDVVLELAHEQRGLIEGQLAFAGFYVVLYLGIAHSSSNDWLRSATLVAGIVLLACGLIPGARSYRRLGRLIAAVPD